MLTKTKIRNFSIFVAILGTLYFIFFFEGSQKKKKNLTKDELSFLFAGTSQGSNSGDEQTIGVDRTKSIFDSDGVVPIISQSIHHFAKPPVLHAILSMSTSHMLQPNRGDKIYQALALGGAFQNIEN